MGLPDVVQHSADSTYVCAVLRHAQQIQRGNAELLADQFPVLYRVKADIIPKRNCALQPNLNEVHNGFQRKRLAVHDQLSRHIPGQHIHDADRQVGCLLGNGQRHFAGGKIGKAERTGTVISIVQRADVVVGIVVQHTAFDQRTRCDDPDHITLHQPFAQRRVCHLLTDCNFIALVHQAFQIEFYAVVRHAAHRRTFFQTAFLSGQCQFQFSGHQNGIFKEHLIEVSQPEKEDTVIVFFFGCCVLLHHWRQLFFWNIC